MPQYTAFLRGVSPMNASMPALKQAFEAAGFTDVRTLLSSGNVVFTARAAAEAALQRKAETAMVKHLGQAFLTIIRRVEALRELLASDPYRGFKLLPRTKRVVTFLLRPPRADVELPIRLEEARILRVIGREVYSVYVPDPRGPDFMRLIERTFGKEVTTRTWETVTKAAR